jgi:hypothetical protein
MASDIIGSSDWTDGTTRLIATQNTNPSQIDLTFVTNQTSGWPYPGIPNPYDGGKIVWLLSKKPVSELTSTYTFDPDTDITGYSSLSIRPNNGTGGVYGGGGGGGAAPPALGGAGYIAPGGGNFVVREGGGGGVLGYNGPQQNNSWFSDEWRSIANYYTIKSIAQFGQNGYNSLAIGIINYWTIEPLATATNQAITEAAVGAPIARSVSTRLAVPVIELSNKSVNDGQVGQNITATILNYSDGATVSWTFDNGSGPLPLDSSLYTVTNNVSGTTCTSIITTNAGAFYQSNAGTYACTVTPVAASPVTRSMILTVNVAVIELSDKTIIDGQVGQNITATILNYYNQLITWTFDDGTGPVPLDSSSYTVTNNVSDTTCTSIITKKSDIFYRGNAGTYACTVTPVGSPPITASMVLTVNFSPPVISSITGGSTSATLGTSTTFTAILAQGSFPVTYAWYFKSINDSSYDDDTVLGLPIFNQTQSFYIILSSTLLDSGKYSCIATNDAGSSPAVTTIFKILSAPTIQPISSQTVLPNTTVQFVCNASGSPPLSYQWRWNGNPITSAIAPIYKITAATDIHVGVYTCTVSNSEGTVTSGDANLAMFRTQTNCIIQANTINSGSGYVSVPSTVITGGRGTGAALSLTRDKQYIRRIRITDGSKMYTTKPTVTISGGGNVGAKAVAIVTDVPTDFTIQSITMPPGYAQKVLSPPITAAITGSGTGATVAVITTPSNSGGIAAIRAWSDMNYLCSRRTWYFERNDTFEYIKPTARVGPHAVNLPSDNPENAIMAAPCFIVKFWTRLSGDVGVSSRDGNGTGCTASLSFEDITGSFYTNGRYPRFLGGSAGFTTVYNPVITITNPGEGYTSTPIFSVTRLQTLDFAGNHFAGGDVRQAWYLVNGGFERGVSVADKRLAGANTSNEFPIFLGLGDTDGAREIGRPTGTVPPAEWERPGVPRQSFVSRELADFMNGGPLPVGISGGALITKGVQVTGVSLTTIGSGYSPSNTNLVLNSSATYPVPPGSYQSTPIIPSNLTRVVTSYPVPVTVIPVTVDYILDSIAILSQGTGFTSTPTITVNGTGGSATAVADMSCFALGPIKPATPSRKYSGFTPQFVIKTKPNSANYNPPKLVAIMKNSDSVASVDIQNLTTNYYPQSDWSWEYDRNAAPGEPFSLTGNPKPLYIKGTTDNSIDNKLYGIGYPSFYRITIDDPPNIASGGVKTYARIPSDGIIRTFAGNRNAASIRKIEVQVNGSGYTSVPKATMITAAEGFASGYFTPTGNNVILKVKMEQEIEAIGVLDSGSGYDMLPLTADIINNNGVVYDTIAGSTGYVSNFTATITNPGEGYTQNTSIFTNAKFIQRVQFTTNSGFTSVPTVTSSDENGSFVATINSAASSGVGLTVTNGGSGYLSYRDPLTNIATNTTSIQITPNILDSQIASGASATPIINGSVTKLLLGNLFPAKMMPWLPDYRPSWCQDFNSPGGNKAGSGYRFEITNEPGCPGSGLSLVPVIKTAAQLGYKHKGAPISTAPYSTTSRAPQPSAGANWYDWTKATPAQHAADAAAGVAAARAAMNAAEASLGIMELASPATWAAAAAFVLASECAAAPFPNTYPMGWNLSIVSGFGNAYDFGNAWAAAGCPFLVGVAISNPGSGYRAPPKIKFITDVLTVGQWDIGSIIQGPIGGLLGVNPGINYVRAPTVSVNVDYNAMNNSKIYPFTINELTDKAPYGTGAVITPSVSGVLANTIRDIFIKDQGMGWTGDAPTLTVTGPEGAVGTATPIMGASYMRIIMGEGGVYTKTPSVVITDGLANGPGKGASAVAIMETIPSGSPNAGKQYVSGVMFSSYGNAYVSPVITFVRDPTDTPGVNATAQAEMIYSSLWPSIATAVPSDANGGNGGIFGLKVSSELCISGTNGPVSGVVQIPSNVTGILDKAFANLSSITSVVFQPPSKCKIIGDPVFENCTSLESVYIPESMEEIQSEAFLGCSNLNKVIFEGNIGPRIYPDVFNGCSPEIKLYTPPGFQGFSADAGGGIDIDIPTEPVTSLITDSRPNVVSFAGYASFKADMSPIVFKSAPLTSDPAGNIYGPYFSIYGYSVYSYSIDSTYSLVNGKPIIPLNSQILNQWVAIVQVVWASSKESSAGGIFILGIPGYSNGDTKRSIYYRLVESLNEDPYLICNELNSEITSMAVDNVGNLLLLQTSEDGKPLLILTADRIAEAIGTGITIEPDGFGQDNELNTEVPSAITCDSDGYIYAALPNAGVVIRYDPPEINVDHAPVLFASGFSQPCALAFDNIGNLYVGNGDSTKLDGISVVSAGAIQTIEPFMNGFYVEPSTLTYDLTTKSLVFSDGSNLCAIPVFGNTTAPVSLIQALATHDYEQISEILISIPGESFVLTVEDISAINSTLSEDAQVAIPQDDPIVYISPNADQSVTVPVGEPETSVIVATSLPPDLSTTVTIGIDVLTVVPNSTSPPTLTVSGSGVDSTQTVGVGESFNTVSGTTVTIYSIGLTVFGAAYGAVFVPGVGGIAPPVCKPKKQGIDYGLFLSSQFFNADVQTYKQKGPVDASEWIRRKRSLNSTKFGTC